MTAWAFALAALLAQAGTAFSATMPPVRMKVLDAEDARPVAGAFVLFQASARAGSITGHGGKTVSLFAAEASSDDTGELRLPKQEFPAQPFFLNTNYENPSMLIFKPGYALVSLQNSRRIIPELEDLTRWEHDGQTIRMKRAGDKEMAEALYVLEVQIGRAMADRALCGWKKFPRFLVAVDRAAADLNRRRDSHASSPLQTLLMNEQLFVEKGCGSPKAFFQPYLQAR